MAYVFNLHNVVLLYCDSVLIFYKIYDILSIKDTFYHMEHTYSIKHLVIGYY